MSTSWGRPEMTFPIRRRRGLGLGPHGRELVFLEVALAVAMTMVAVAVLVAVVVVLARGDGSRASRWGGGALVDLPGASTGVGEVEEGEG